MSIDPVGSVAVVGAGLGGLRLVEELRRCGHTGPIALVGEESAHPYDRPPLSKAVLQDGGPAPLLRPVEDYAELEVDLRLGRRATALDAATRSLTLDDGCVLAGDAVVLAPGATPRRLPGPSLPGLHVLRTQDDATALRQDVVREGRLAVVGGGFLGCEVAASARRLGAEVDLVELLAGPLVRVLGPVMAERVAALHRERGVRLHVGVGVDQVLGEDRVEGLHLSDGRVLPARTVLVGLGVVPSTQWLATSGLALEPDGGVRCDRFGRTSAPGVWALGDAAAWQDAGGTHRRVEHWSSAVEQAAVVAQNLVPADGLVPHSRVSYVWSDQYDSTLQCVGEVAPGTEAEVFPVGPGLAALHADGDRLLGVALLDARRQAGRARKLLAAGSDLTQARAALLR